MYKYTSFSLNDILCKTKYKNDNQVTMQLWEMVFYHKVCKADKKTSTLFSIFIFTNKTATMYRPLVVLVFTVFMYLSGHAQKGNVSTGYCLMRVFDINKFAASGGGFIGSKIIVTYETGDQEVIELQPYSEKTEPDNLKKFVETLNVLKKKGYILMSANSTGDQGNIVTDYVLLKQAY